MLEDVFIFRGEFLLCNCEEMPVLSWRVEVGGFMSCDLSSEEEVPALSEVDELASDWLSLSEVGVLNDLIFTTSHDTHTHTHTHTLTCPQPRVWVVWKHLHSLPLTISRPYSQETSERVLTPSPFPL